MAQTVDTRLIVYGTLAPGRVNHHQIATLNGAWRKGTVTGWLRLQAGAAGLGYPALVLDPLGPRVEVDVFESPDLPEHWARLDEFEGSDYRRVMTRVSTADGELDGWIYVSAKAIDPDSCDS